MVGYWSERKAGKRRVDSTSLTNRMHIGCAAYLQIDNALHVQKDKT